MMIKRISCLSCETKCDVMIKEANYDEVEIQWCPVCSAELDYVVYVEDEEDD